MATLDTNLALGVRPIQIENPMAQYSQIAQIQNARNQNALAKYQLGAAERENNATNALNLAYQQAYDPATGKIDINKLRGSLSTGGFGSKLPAIEKTIVEMDKERVLAQKAQTELLDAKLKQARGFLDTIDPMDPTAPAKYIAWHEANHRDPIVGPALEARGITADQSLAQIKDAIAKGPQAFADLVNGSKLGTEKFIEMNKPVTFEQNTGTGLRLMQRPGLGGPATVVPGSEITKGKTFADLNASARLAFDRDKFAWEKANPGYTIQQAEDGSIVGINNRSLQAFPVSLNASAPPAAAPFATGQAGRTAAPAPGGAGKRGGAVAPAAAPIMQPRGEPLKGKSAGLTESQGNAAMFGSAMAQAQQVLDQAEREGTTTGAGTVNLAQGIVKYVPLGVGDKLVNDIYALAVNDPTKLFGPDVNQQKVGQAQLAFAIAYLRKTSGAAFGPSEVANTIMEYFPSVGEDKAVVKQKTESRKRAIAGMKMGAGREGAKFIEQYESPSGSTSGSGASASDPLGLFPAKKP
jgi:hypothetical protein